MVADGGAVSVIANSRCMYSAISRSDGDSFILFTYPPSIGMELSPWTQRKLVFSA